MNSFFLSEEYVMKIKKKTKKKILPLTKIPITKLTCGIIYLRIAFTIYIGSVLQHCPTVIQLKSIKSSNINMCKICI